MPTDIVIHGCLNGDIVRSGLSDGSFAVLCDAVENDGRGGEHFGGRQCEPEPIDSNQWRKNEKGDSEKDNTAKYCEDRGGSAFLDALVIAHTADVYGHEKECGGV